jgi:hypothetical protein
MLARTLAVILALGFAVSQAQARRVGFQGFDGRFKGGYSILVGDENVGSGESVVRIRAMANGRSARVTWINTFYGPRGSWKIPLQWRFVAGGAFSGNSIDLRTRGPAAKGTFKIDRGRPIAFTATDSTRTATGTLKLVGGGAMLITVTLTGGPEGPVTYTFSGGK